MSTTGRTGRNKAIYQQLADEVVKVRADIYRRRNDTSRRGPLPPQQAILGGIVKAFQFNYEPGKTQFAGTFWFDVGDGARSEHEATFILKRHHGADTCYDIVDKTSMLNHEAVLAVYFAAYCEELSTWVIACEKFESYLFDEIQKEPAQITLPPFFTDPLLLELDEFWRLTVRNLIRVLALSRTKGVVLNNLNNREGYVISSGEIKVFGIGIPTESYESHAQDLQDLRDFFWSTPFFNGGASAEWQGFDYLFSSGYTLMNVHPIYWEAVVLNHPTLLSVSADPADNHGRLTCYLDIERFMWNDLTESGRVEFINALYAAMPGYRYVSISTFPRQGVTFTQQQNIVYGRIYAKSSPDTRIYAAVIQTVRNIVRHGYDCSVGTFTPGWDKRRIAQEIKWLFGGFMSMAYTVSKLPTQWQNMAAKLPRSTLYYN